MLQRKTMVASGILFLGLSSLAFGAEVSVEKARPVAENWLSNAAAAQRLTNSQYQIVREEVIMVSGQTVGYNFILAPAGHIIVPSRDELPVVKLYSLTSSLSMTQNSQVAEWIKDELNKLNNAIDSHAAEMAGVDHASTRNGKLWARFGKAPALFAQESVTREGELGLVLGPLLATTWDQTDPYNLQTPLWYDGTPTYTGCVATAAAQILKYWNYPPTGQDSKSYTWNNGSVDVTLSANFAASTYDWTNMLNTYTGSETPAQKNAVAKLMSDVGIAFEMDYGAVGMSGSGAYTMDGVTVYPTYFGYKNTIQAVYRSNYATDSAWMQVFKTEVQNSRPSQFRMRDPDAGGHSIVIDGYRDDPSEQIHLNLGWSGSYDGWYVSNNIVTGSYNWSDVNYQGAVIGIEPSSHINRAPVVEAGPNQTITLPGPANLAGTVTDDGLPNPPGMVTITWAKVSGPGTVTFADPSSAATTATFSSTGSYVLSLTGDDSALSTTDQVTITVQNGTASPCDGLCTNSIKFTIAQYHDYQGQNLGTDAVCYETTSTITGGNCGNFASPRTLSVNGTTKTCNYQNWSSVPAKRNGGYCIQTTAGNYPWAYFAVWW